MAGGISLEGSASAVRSPPLPPAGLPHFGDMMGGALETDVSL